MKIECIIFDFDGTLFDSMFIWESAGENYIRSLGKIPNDSLSYDVKTLSLLQSAQYLKEEYDLSMSVEEIMLGINQTIEYFYIYEVLPKEAIIDLLNQLHLLNIPLCIASATDRYLIESALKRCHMDHYFDKVFTCGEVGHGKDEPDIYRQAMNYYNAKHHTTIIFEDALHAIKVAKEDGFIVVGVYDQSENEQESIKKISNYYIKDYKNIEYILNIIKGVN